MLLIICVERLLHIGSHFSLRKWRRQPHFPTKLAAVALFSYKVGGGSLIFLQNWLRRQGFGNITGAVLTLYSLDIGVRGVTPSYEVRGVTPTDATHCAKKCQRRKVAGN